MTDAFIEAPAAPAESRSQLVAAILLGIAATLTAVAAYNAALKDGDALEGYSRSTQTLADANYFYAQGNQTYALDQQLFVSYATADQAGNTELVDYLTDLMRPELVAAIEWWEATEDAVTPFDDEEGNPYELEDESEAERLEAESKAMYREAAAADKQGDQFELAAVLLALTLFFGGVATLFRSRRVTNVLLLVASVILTAGALRLVTAL